jgi:hypothetical protein
LAFLTRAVFFGAGRFFVVFVRFVADFFAMASSQSLKA